MGEEFSVRFGLNGRPFNIRAEANEILSDVLRERCECTSVKVGCDQGVCGACTVLLDGAPAISCTTFAFEADNTKIMTIEGLNSNSTLHPIQKAFLDCDAFQCGFCTAGIILSTLALLRQNPKPSRELIRQWLGAHVCRCTGYEMIIDAIEAGGIAMREVGV
jgi:carbon-monoxide dehydrogenase small subunit